MQGGVQKGRLRWSIEVTRPCDVLWMGVSATFQLDVSQWIARDPNVYSALPHSTPVLGPVNTYIVWVQRRRAFVGLPRPRLGHTHQLTSMVSMLIPSGSDCWCLDEREPLANECWGLNIDSNRMRTLPRSTTMRDTYVRTYVRMKSETNKMHMKFNIRVTVCSGQRGVIVPRALL